jgi:hypothetical protein
MNRRSKTALPSSNTDSEVSGGRATRSTTCTGGGPHRADTPATPITPSCMVAPHQRTGIRRPKASAMASPNSYFLLGEDEEPGAAADDSPPSGSSDPRATAHGWDSFVNSLNATAKGELGAIDEILISYANFAGGEFRAFDVESAKVMGQITAMEEAMDHDHSEVVQTRGSLTKLEEIVLANANGISDLMAILRENVSTVANLQRTVDKTSTPVKTMSDALREVTETATNAFRLASRVQPTITGHGVRLDTLVDDVSKMSSDINGLRASYTSMPDHATQLALLEGMVSRIDSEFVALRKLLNKQSVPDMSGDSRTVPTEDTSASPDDVDTPRAQRKSPPELEGRRDVKAKATVESTDTTNDLHPLFPNADPAYRTTRVPQRPEVVHDTTPHNVADNSHVVVDDSPDGTSPPKQNNQWSWPPPMESRRSPFQQDQFPRNPYQAHPYVPTQRNGTIRQHLDESRRMGPTETDV